MTEKEVTDYLWTKSTEIEPRNVDPSQKKKLSVKEAKSVYLE